MPDVEFSLLKEDLFRRDFTINAMAIAINKKCFGQLIDFYKGQEDLNSKTIRVLHDKSFIDDPTRIFRAVRFEQRLDFHIEERTQHLIKTAIKENMFGRTEKQRIKDELILILSEENPLKAIRRMNYLDELRFVHPNLNLTVLMADLFKSIKELCRWYNRTRLKEERLEEWLIYLMAIFEGLKFSSVRSLCEKFAFKRSERLRILSAKKMPGKILKALEKNPKAKPSRVYKLLHGLSPETIIFTAAMTKNKKIILKIKEYLLKYAFVEVDIRGSDLKCLGLEPSPRFRKILNHVLYAKIDGLVKSKKDEIELAGKLIEEGA